MNEDPLISTLVFTRVDKTNFKLENDKYIDYNFVINTLNVLLIQMIFIIQEI